MEDQTVQEGQTVQESQPTGDMPSWEAVAPDFQKNFPTLDQEAVKKYYESSRKMADARRAASAIPEDTGSFLRRKALPFVSTGIGVSDSVKYGRALQRLQAGAPDDEDYHTIARHEALMGEDKKRDSTLGGQLGEAAVGLPKMVGEFAAGSAVLKAGASAAPGALGWLAPRAAEAGAKVAVPLLTTVAQAVGRNAAQTLLVPSMYAEHWTQNNIDAGRDPLDVRGFVPAVGLGMLQTAVLGQIGKAGQSIPGEGFGPWVQRMRAGAAAGIAGQQVADLIAGSTGLQTGYGLVGDVLQGKSGEALKHLTVQAFTFAAFSALHAHENPEVLKAYQAALQEQARRGMPVESAAKAISQAAEPIVAGLAENPEMSAMEARQKIEGLPPGKVRGFVESIADALGKKKPSLAPEAVDRAALEGKESEAGLPPVDPAERAGMSAEVRRLMGLPPEEPAKPSESPSPTQPPTPRPAATAEPGSAREQASALEAEHIKALKAFHDAKNVEAREIASRGMGLANKAKEAKQARQASQRELKRIEAAWEAARTKAAAEEAQAAPPAAQPEPPPLANNTESTPPPPKPAAVEEPPDRVAQLRQTALEMNKDKAKNVGMTPEGMVEATEKRVQSLGSVEAVDKAFAAGTPLHVYARNLARKMFGEKAAEPARAGSPPAAAPKPAAIEVALRAFQQRWGMSNEEMDRVRSDPKTVEEIVAKHGEVASKQEKLAEAMRSGKTGVAADKEIPGRYVLQAGQEEAGHTQLGNASADNNEARAARNLFPSVVEPGKTVARIQAVEVEPLARGKGNGQKLILESLRQHGADWYFNSQASPDLVEALQSLERKGEIELHWRNEEGGPFVARLKQGKPRAEAAAGAAEAPPAEARKPAAVEEPPDPPEVVRQKLARQIGRLGANPEQVEKAVANSKATSAEEWDRYANDKNLFLGEDRLSKKKAEYARELADEAGRQQAEAAKPEKGVKPEAVEEAKKTAAQQAKAAGVAAARQRYDNREKTAGGGGLFGGEDLQARRGFAKLPDGARVLFVAGELEGHVGTMGTEGKVRGAYIEGRPGLVAIGPEAIEPLNAAQSWRTSASTAPAQQGSLLNASHFLPKGKDRWTQEAIDAGVEPGQMHREAAEQMASHKQDVKEYNDVLKEARNSGSPAFRAAMKNIRSERYEDAAQVPGIDDVAATMQAQHPALFPEGSIPSNILFTMLKDGNRKEMTQDAIYDRALEKIRLEKDRYNAEKEAARSGISESRREEIVRNGEEAGEAEGMDEAARSDTEGADTSFDFGANEGVEDSPEPPKSKGLRRFVEDERGSLDLDKLKAGWEAVKKFFVGKPTEGSEGSVVDDIKKAFAPATRGKEAEVGAGNLRYNLAKERQAKVIAQEEMQKAQSFFREWTENAPTPELRDQRFLAFMDAMQHDDTLASLPPELRPFGEAGRKLLEQREQQAVDRGLIAQETIKNYLAQLWEKPGSNLTSEQIANILGARRPLQGKQGFRHRRIIEDYRAGMEAGLKPVSYNPIDLILLSLGQVDKAVMAHDAHAEWSSNGLYRFIEVGGEVPEGWTRHQGDTIFTRGRRGPETLGHFYSPEPLTRLVNNYLEPGLRGNKVYDAVREFGGVLTNFQLGFTAFHAGFVTVDTMVSQAALGLRQMSQGKVLQGLGNILTSPYAPIRDWSLGSKLLAEYKKPGSQGAEMGAILDALLQGGGSINDTFIEGGHIKAFTDAIRSVRRGEGGVGSVLYNALPALSEFFSKPVMEQLVPRMKLGVFADMARAEMEKLPANADSNAKQAAYGRAWDSVENRLGQMTYDNLFWNRTFKDLAMVSVRAVGWNLGTWRELGGGLKDLGQAYQGIKSGEGISHRLAYVAALPIMVGAMGAFYQYLATGKGPDETKDYFFPRTGKRRPDGSEDRVALPSYMRDVASLLNRADEGPMRIAQNAYTMAKHKANPLISVVADMLGNEDFHGTAIRNPNDPMVKQSTDTAFHLLKAMKPMGADTILRQKERGDLSASTAAQGFVGVTPATSNIVHSWQEQRDKESGRRFEPTGLEKKRREDAGSLSGEELQAEKIRAKLEARRQRSGRRN